MRDLRKRHEHSGRRVAFTLLAAALTSAASADAAKIVFETVEAPSAQVGESCPAPCFNVRMYFEDPTRNLEIQALQFDVAIVSGVTAAKLPVPPASSNQAASGNVGGAPWTLSATVGKSPREEFDALVVNAAAAPFTLSSAQAWFDAGCEGANCSILGDGLAADRLYLGRFNATLTGDASFRIDGITGDGAAIQELRAFHTPDWAPPSSPPPVASPAPTGPPSTAPVTSPAPAEDPPVVSPDRPIFIGIACGTGCLAVRRCESESCTELFRGSPDSAVFFATSNGLPLVLSQAEGPEPAVVLLLALGAAFVVLLRRRTV